MRLAILGNSHSACLLHAVRDNPDLLERLDVTFYGAIGKNMADFAVQDDRLVPQTEYLRQSIATTSGGDETFDPAAFDAILMIGLGYNISPIDHRLSAAVRDAIILNLAAVSTSWKLAELIREISGTQIFVGHSPLRAGNIMPRNRHLVDSALPYDEVIARQQDIWNEHNAIVVKQPKHTRFEDVLTKRSYSRGSRGLRGEGLEHDGTDRSHMNAEFGADYIRNLRSMLALS